MLCYPIPIPNFSIYFFNLFYYFAFSIYSFSCYVCYACKFVFSLSPHLSSNFPTLIFFNVYFSVFSPQFAVFFCQVFPSGGENFCSFSSLFFCLQNCLTKFWKPVLNTFSHQLFNVFLCFCLGRLLSHPSTKTSLKLFSFSILVLSFQYGDLLVISCILSLSLVLG